MPRDPQGAGTRTETRVEFNCVFADGDTMPAFTTKEQAKEYAAKMVRRFGLDDATRLVAVEEVTTVTTITRHPIPPHAGEETKG